MNIPSRTQWRDMAARSTELKAFEKSTRRVNR